MSRERVERVIRSAYAARVRGDLDAVMTHFADAPHFSLAGSAAAAIREVMRRLIDSFEFLESEIVDLIVDGDRAAVQTRVLMRPSGGGEAVQTEMADILRLDGDRIASTRQFAETALAVESLKR